MGLILDTNFAVAGETRGARGGCASDARDDDSSLHVSRCKICGIDRRDQVKSVSYVLARKFYDWILLNFVVKYLDTRS